MEPTTIAPVASVYDIAVVTFPVIFALLALAVAWGAVLAKQKTMKEDIDKMKGANLTEKDHELLCLNNTLRFEAHVTKVVEDMGKKIVKKVEELVSKNSTKLK